MSEGLEIKILYGEQFKRLALGSGETLFSSPLMTTVPIEDNQEQLDNNSVGSTSPVGDNVPFVQFIDSLKLPAFKGSNLVGYFSKVRGTVRNEMPPRSLWPNIVGTMAVVQEAQKQLGGRVLVSSSYRAPAYNARIGGAKNSYHMRFMALDLNFTGSSPATVAQALKRLRGSKIYNPYTKNYFVFAGGIGTYSNFVHIDTRGSNINW